MNRWLARCWDRVNASVPALPLDVFRMAAAAVTIAFLGRAWWDASVYLGPHGLLPVGRSREIFWFTAQPLFDPLMSVAAVRGVLGGAICLAFAVLVGAWPRRCAFALFLILVCLYRHMFLVIGIDDAIAHLLMFWCFVLPVGRTLTMGRDQNAGHWIETRVAGFAARMLLVNVALLYLVAGVTKWSSSLWLDGYAVYAVCKLPAGWFSNAVTADHIPLTQVLTYSALVFETVVAAIVVLRPHSAAKRVLLAGLVAFHLGVSLMLDVGLANFGCLAFAAIVFRHEIVAAARAIVPGRLRRPHDASSPPTWTDAYCAVAVALLVVGMLAATTQAQWRQPPGETRPGRHVLTEAGSGLQRVAFSGLWLLGLAQQYRLLDWIDERNFALHIRVTEHLQDGTTTELDPQLLVPRGMRSTLLMSYVFDVTWMPVPDDDRAPVRAEIIDRLQHRTCSLWPGRTVTVRGTIERIDPRVETQPRTETLLHVTCGARS